MNYLLSVRKLLPLRKKFWHHQPGRGGWELLERLKEVLESFKELLE